jgi:hypothetical protein
MQSLRWLLVVLVLVGPAGADPCGPGAEVDYPLSAVLRDEALGYLVEAITDKEVPPDPDPLLPYGSAYRLLLEEKAADLPDRLSDLPYLIVLSEVSAYPDPFHSLTFMAQSTVLPRIIAAAERQGLTAEASLLRVPMIRFPDWDSGPGVRREVILRDGSAGLTGAAMRAAATSLHRSAPAIRAATEALIAGDPAMAAAYEARRQAVGPDLRMNHLVGLLVSKCLADWWTPQEADAAFAGMAALQADLLLLHFFLAESFNGSTHQYFHNSSGTMAPQLADLLEGIGLPDHAAGIRAGMAVFPAPYPRDTEARRDAMAGFSEAQDEALYDLTVWADDGMILDAMVRLAEEAGLMPR